MRMTRCFLLTAIAAAGCGGYTAPDEVTLGTAVYTQQAPGADFKPLSTYYLDPTMDVFEDGVQKPSTALPSSSATLIDTRMQAFGYTKVATVPPPNVSPAATVGLRATTLSSTYTYYYSYCDYYWGWYGCYPSWGYAGSYSTGTVVLTMLDLRTDPPVGGQRPVLWVSGLYSVLTGVQAESSVKFNNALNTAFDQSPYLDTH